MPRNPRHGPRAEPDYLERQRQRDAAAHEALSRLRGNSAPIPDVYQPVVVAEDHGWAAFNPNPRASYPRILHPGETALFTVSDICRAEQLQYRNETGHDVEIRSLVDGVVMARNQDASRQAAHAGGL